MIEVCDAKDIIETGMEAVRDFAPHHTAFQIEHFMVGSGGTLYGQWRQCQREIAARLGEAKRQDASTLAELQELVLIEARLRLELVEAHGCLSPTVCERLEYETWRWRARKELAMDYLIGGVPSRGTLEMILRMPGVVRVEMLEVIRAQRAAGHRGGDLISWFEQGAEPSQMPALPAGGCDGPGQLL